MWRAPWHKWSRHIPATAVSMQALQTYTELAKNDDGELLPPVKKTIAPGDTYPGVPRLTRLLRLLGDLPADADVPADGTTYDAALVDAVKNFQRRHGRDPDGRIGAQTLADLNVPLSRRVQQMQLALERWRWMPESYQRAPIIVNIPEFRLRAYDKDFNVAVTMNVIVGNSFGHDTPVFADDDGTGGFPALLGGSALHCSIGTDSAHPRRTRTTWRRRASKSWTAAKIRLLRDGEPATQ